MLTTNDNIIKSHYKKEAENYGSSSDATTGDIVVREKEIQQLFNFIKIFSDQAGTDKPMLKILDIGCGNGYTLSKISEFFPENQYWGLEFTEELYKIAKNRNLPDCEIINGDVRSMPFDDSFFDLIYTERCLINILDWEQQKLAISEIHRILKNNGHYFMIEAFTDGLESNNKARTECGLEPLAARYHNRYFDKKLFFSAIQNLFDIIDPEKFNDSVSENIQTNFLSSHYFIARVLHPLVTKGKQIKNTEFVKFFSFLPPIGNYSPVQAVLLKKGDC